MLPLKIKIFLWLLGIVVVVLGGGMGYYLLQYTTLEAKYNKLEGDFKIVEAARTAYKKRTEELAAQVDTERQTQEDLQKMNNNIWRKFNALKGDIKDAERDESGELSDAAVANILCKAGLGTARVCGAKGKDSGVPAN